MFALLRSVLHPSRSAGERRTAARHWHRFRWAGEDTFSGSGLYACRCGVVRPGL